MARLNGKSLTQIAFMRRALLARLDHGGVDESEADGLMRQIEDLDLAIAATPAKDAAELLLKIELLALIIAPAPDNDTDSLESILLRAVLRDAQSLQFS